MSLHDYFILVAAFLTFIVAPIWLLWAFIHGLRYKAVCHWLRPILSGICFEW